MAFLETPTQESLKGYLAWRKERSQKLAKAMALLNEHRRSLMNTSDPVSPQIPPTTRHQSRAKDKPASISPPSPVDHPKSVELLYDRLRLRWLRRKYKVIDGGKKERKYMN